MDDFPSGSRSLISQIRWNRVAGWQLVGSSLMNSSQREELLNIISAFESTLTFFLSTVRRCSTLFFFLSFPDTLRVLGNNWEATSHI